MQMPRGPSIAVAGTRQPVKGDISPPGLDGRPVEAGGSPCGRPTRLKCAGAPEHSPLHETAELTDAEYRLGEKSPPSP